MKKIIIFCLCALLGGSGLVFAEEAVNVAPPADAGMSAVADPSVAAPEADHHKGDAHLKKAHKKDKKKHHHAHHHKHKHKKHHGDDAAAQE